MEKVLKLFKRDLKTSRLELRLISPTKKLAEDFWNIIKNENPDDFKYISFSLENNTPLPQSEQETFDTLVKECKEPNTINYAIYNNNSLIGFTKIIYWENNTTLEIGNTWLVKSAWRQGFVKEIAANVEKVALLEPAISRMGWQCFEPNIGSKMAALHSGYNILKSAPDSIKKDLLRVVLVKPLPVVR
jgi:RimJ/RimL family protein N-acetyltransferase